ncbi:MAG: dinitrogenase iron-molybdenum cofactor biosynthesis protein [Lentisphaeria bacterium]|nr:dinitrogenase iron-molybdenum cofactor biosynthesis protein [Lentisphaeria bacterium]
MKIAVTCENGMVFQHFGHTPGFAIFEAEDNKIISEKQLSSGDSGHGALATLLAAENVDVLICGGIGGGAINALSNAGIKVVGGAEGDVRAVAVAFVNGVLQVRENFHCNHHHHDGGHTCGSGSCSH